MEDGSCCPLIFLLNASILAFVYVPATFFLNLLFYWFLFSVAEHREDCLLPAGKWVKSWGDRRAGCVLTHGHCPTDPGHKGKSWETGSFDIPRHARDLDQPWTSQDIQPSKWCQRKDCRKASPSVQGVHSGDQLPVVWGQGPSRSEGQRQDWRIGSPQLGWKFKICWECCLSSHLSH